VVADRGAVLDADAVDRRRQLERAAQLGEQLDQAAHQRAGAALGEPHAPGALEVVDQRVDRRGLEGVAADQERVERQRLADVLVLHVAGDGAVHRAIGAQPAELRRDLDHVPEPQERRRRELGVAGVEHLRGVVAERS
jgi:hypothetical protein